MPGESTRYQWIRDLGKGAFGCVVLAEDTSNHQLVAVKKLPRALACDTHTERELLLHSRLKHPHIVKFRSVFLSKQHCNIVMEYVPDGTLLSHVQQAQRLSEDGARWLFQQLIFGVDYIHRLNICNRDIKLDNILLDKSLRGQPEWPILKLCDWGYARADPTSNASSKVGTLSYMAPEVLQNNGGYSAKKADIWSCGVVLYAMLVGGMPFCAVNPTNLARGIMTLLADMQAQRYSLPASLSPEAKDLVQQLLQPDPQQRISIAGIMRHPWFLQGLPAAALAMNDGYLRNPHNNLQTEAEIWAVIYRARQTAVVADDDAAQPIDGHALL